MSLTEDDFANLGKFIDSRIAAAAPAPAATPATAPGVDPEVERAKTVGTPDVAPDAGPEFYVHLANGEVIKSHDSSSTHFEAPDGSTIQVIGRYQVGN